MARGELDRFGGYPGVALGASGFFRVEKTDRWWLVTPEGNAFLSFGMNHVMLDLLMCDYSKDFWAGQLGVTDTSDKKLFLPGFRRKVSRDLVAFGMNTLGCHSPTSYYPESFVPYVAQCRFVDICHYMTPTEADFPDVFSEEFEKHCDRVAMENALPRKDDPFLIGYSMTDCPIFTDLDAGPRGNNVYGKARPGLPTWPRVLRNMGAGGPGKEAYVQTMREVYSNNVMEFNRVYGTHFDSFDGLLRAKGWRPAADSDNSRETQDNLRFLVRIVDRCYAVEVAAVRRHDPNHLILGDKLNGNTDTPDEIVALAAKHMDLIFYQYYAVWAEQKRLVDRLSRIARKAIFHGDSCYSVPTDRMPDPYGPHCAGQEERAALTKESLDGAFARDDYVGWNWCGWMDSWESNQPGKQHSGLQDPFGQYHAPIHKTMAQFSARKYEIATNG